MQPERHNPLKSAMVVDDDDFFRMALSGILKQKHQIDNIIEMSEFYGVHERLETIPELSVAFFDIHMPGMNDIEQLRHLRSTFPGVKIAVVSGSMTKASIMQALECGLHGYVWKLSGSQEVSRAIEVILGGNIYVPSVLADLPIDPMDAPVPSIGLDVLTRRQTEVLRLLTSGASNREIASRLGLGEGTIKIHVSGLLRALKVGRRSEAAEVGRALLGRRAS